MAERISLWPTMVLALVGWAIGLAYGEHNARTAFVREMERRLRNAPAEPLVRLPQPGQRLPFDEEEAAEIRRTLPAGLADGTMPLPAHVVRRLEYLSWPQVLKAFHIVAGRRIRVGRLREAGMTCLKAIATEPLAARASAELARGLNRWAAQEHLDARHAVDTYYLFALAQFRYGDHVAAKGLLDEAVRRLAKTSAWRQARGWCRVIKRGSEQPPLSVQMYAFAMGRQWAAVGRALEMLRLAIEDPQRAPATPDAALGRPLAALSTAHEAMAATTPPPGFEEVHATALDITRRWHEAAGSLLYGLDCESTRLRIGNMLPLAFKMLPGAPLAFRVRANSGGFD